MTPFDTVRAWKVLNSLKNYFIREREESKIIIMAHVFDERVQALEVGMLSIYYAMTEEERLALEDDIFQD